MKKLLGITAALAGLGAAAWWVKNNVTVDISKDAETPDETAELDAAEAEAAAKTAAELEAAAGDPVKTAVAKAKGWVRSHVTVTVRKDEEAPAPEEEPEEEPDAEVYAEPAAPAAAPAADEPNPNPVEAAPAAAPVDGDGKLDPTAIADPQDFADWDEQGCKG